MSHPDNHGYKEKAPTVAVVDYGNSGCCEKLAKPTTNRSALYVTSGTVKYLLNRKQVHRYKTYLITKKNSSCRGHEMTSCHRIAERDHYNALPVVKSAIIVFCASLTT